MLAIIAAIVFVISLIFDWAGVAAGDILTSDTLLTIGLILLALHLAGIGPAYQGWPAKSGSGGGRRWRR